MRVRVIDGPPGHIFTIEECRAQCRVVPYDSDSDGVQTHPDDAQLLGYLDAALEMAEDFTGLSIAVRTYEGALDCFPRSRCAIEVLRPPLLEVVSFTSGLDSDSSAVSDYAVDDFSRPARLVPISSWPSAAAETNAIRIVYRAGFEDDSDGSTVPKTIRQAIMLTLADWYNNREDSTDQQPYTLPNGAEALLRPHRVLLGIA